jgi:acyl-coenzyme A thioesterase PaaI-like protein
MPTEDDRLVFDQSRTVSWASTVSFRPRMAKMSGREVLEAIQAGLLAPPPLARVIGFHIVAVGDGQAEFALEPREDLENLAGALHGGVAATLLDNTLGAAVQSLLPAGARSATLNLNVSYLGG